jgi:DNA polymerase-1
MGSKYAVNTAHSFLQLPEITLGIYNCWDSYQTAKLVHPLLNELQSRGNLDYATQVMEPLQTAVINMQARGLLLDKEALRAYRKQVLCDLDDTDRIILAADPTGELRKRTPKYPNSIGSPKKLGNFLFNTLGLKPPKKTETGLDSTDQETLYRILRNLRKKDEPHRPILLALFHRSRLRTILQRYLNLETDQDGRVRAKVKMYGTKTWRFAYAEPALQQFPPEARHVFKAAEGHTFCQADFSQLESRILAYLSSDRPLIEVFLSNGDIHKQNGSDLFGVELSEVTEAQRYYSKGWFYQLQYGGAADSMKSKTYCPCPVCEAVFPPTMVLKQKEMKAMGERWFTLHPAVIEFQEQTARFIRKHHYYQSPLGGRRWIAKPWGPELEREAKNLPMQFGGALLMNQRQVALDRKEAPIVFQMHDSFLLEVPTEEVDFWAEMVQTIMEAPVDGLGGVSIPADIKVGKDWGNLEKWQGPTSTQATQTVAGNGRAGDTG